ncbi:DUF6503 family protein [Eudoraea sp.]|uniref:DUF6503 family protein n=1 Tax=Eudoraea sp. TaxID=1979955 RepID=UPI003C7498B7
MVNYLQIVRQRPQLIETEMRIIFLSLIFLGLFSCKESSSVKADKNNSEVLSEKIIQSKYPDALDRVFKAHGGLQNWTKKKVLVYDLPKAGYTEIHTTDLITRMDKIVSPDYSLGFDGKHVWLLDKYGSYKGDPVFYHNLMFYFYAMPFVLADDGIIYGETTNLIFEGKSYPGISISYDSGVGTSPKDEYFLHYDPQTYQMAWLGYTVTYNSGEKSDNVKWIRYDQWMEVTNIILPKAMTWYAYEGKVIKEAKNTVQFDNIVLSETSKPETFYAMPEGSKIIERPQQ